jgi:hypothetical protein
MRTLILTYKEPITEDNAKYISDKLKEALPGVQVIVLDGCTSVTMIETPTTSEALAEELPAERADAGPRL